MASTIAVLPASVDRLIAELKTFPNLPNVFNPFSQYDHEHDCSKAAPYIRIENLRRYLSCRILSAKYIFCAEAAGWRGCKFTGIAMTDERLMMGGKPKLGFGPSAVFDGEKKLTSTHAPNGMVEVTSSVIYGFLSDYGINPRDTVFWNAFPLHPHLSGNSLSNRTPVRAEIESVYHLHMLFFRIFPHCKVIAVGNHAKALLDQIGIESSVVRHPANGGAGKFVSQASDALGVTRLIPEYQQSSLFCE